MANTITPAAPDGMAVEISNISADFVMATYLGTTNFEILAILFVPYTAGERVPIRNTNLTGGQMAHFYSLDGLSVQKDQFDEQRPFGQRYQPCIEFDDCVITSANTRIIIRYRYKVL